MFGKGTVVLMNKYKCGKSTIYDIKKNKEKIVSYLSTRETTSGMIKRKTLKQGSNESVEKAVYLWFLQERARGTPISGTHKLKHKLKPLLIAKYQKPRCFKNTNIELLPVHYCAQRMHG